MRTVLSMVMTVVFTIAFIIADYLDNAGAVIVAFGLILSGLATFISLFKEE
jgi:hypothetical protein